MLASSVESRDTVAMMAAWWWALKPSLMLDVLLAGWRAVLSGLDGSRS